MKSRFMKVLFAVALSLALLGSSMFAGLLQALAADSGWKALDPVLDRMEVLNAAETEFYVNSLQDVLDVLFGSVLSAQEKSNLHLKFGLDGMQFAGVFDNYVRQVYQDYEGFLDAVKQDPRNWQGGGNLDFVFDKAYESLPAGFRNNLAAGMGWDLSFEKQLPLMDMLFGLKYDSDLNIDPQSSADVLAYVEDNSKITVQDLEYCGLTFSNLQAALDQLGDGDKATLAEVLEKMGKIQSDENPLYELTVVTDKASYEQGEQVNVSGTLNKDGSALPHVNIGLCLKEQDTLDIVALGQVITDADGSFEWTIPVWAMAGEGTYVLFATANVTEAAVLFNVEDGDIEDLTPPSINGTTPSDGATAVLIGQTITVSFSEDVVAGETYDSITMKDSGNNSVGFAKSVSGSTLTIDPASDLVYGMTYSVCIPDGAVQDNAGNALIGERTFSFTTISGDDNTPPVITGTSPSSGATGVSLSQTVTVTFSEAVAAGGSFSGITMKDSDNSVTFTKSVSGSSLTIDPTGDLAYSKTYSVYLPAGAAQDTAGNPLANEYTFSFTTKASGGGGGGGGGVSSPSPLEVNKYDPAKDATEVALDAAVKVTFKQEIKANDLAKVSITDSKGNKVTGVKAGIDGKILALAHDDFNYDTVYKVKIEKGAVERESNSADNSEINWSFTTMKEPVVTPEQLFKDVPPGHWAFDIINSLFNAKIVGGYPDGTFRPENSITRAEFSRMLTNALGLADGNPGAPTFSDVKPGDWYYGCVEAAVKADLVKGYETGEFRPDALITRQEMTVILVRAMGLLGSANANAGSGTSFVDDSGIASWARGFVVTSTQQGLVGGYPDNTFRAEANATRAEACAMVYKLLEKKTK